MSTLNKLRVSSTSNGSLFLTPFKNTPLSIFAKSTFFFVVFLSFMSFNVQLLAQSTTKDTVKTVVKDVEIKLTTTTPAKKWYEEIALRG